MSLTSFGPTLASLRLPSPVLPRPGYEPSATAPCRVAPRTCVSVRNTASSLTDLTQSAVCEVIEEMSPNLLLGPAASRPFDSFHHSLRAWVAVRLSADNGEIAIHQRNVVTRRTLRLLLLLLLLLLHPFSGLFSMTTWVRRYQEGKTSLDLDEARDDGVLGRSGISWTICKQSAPRSMQTDNHTTPRHSIFTGRMLFLTPNQ